jgi:hypothetical protein
MLKPPGSVARVSFISASGQTLLVFQTPGMQERKKEMSWMYILSVLWGAGNLFNG